MKEIDIYGAQLFACTMYKALTYLGRHRVYNFIVTSKENNPTEIDSIPVVEWGEYLKRSVKREIWVAVPEEYWGDIGELLDKTGRKEYCFVTNDIRNSILKEFYGSYFKNFKVLENVTESEMNFFLKQEEIMSLFCVSSVHDKMVSECEMSQNGMLTIEAGAQLSGGVLNVCYKDDVGDNISVKNRDYCELTALYWIWKNVKCTYKGMCHYRRIFEKSVREIQSVMENGIEAVLPYPTIHFPNIRAEHMRYLREEEWEIVELILKENCSEQYAIYEEILEGQFFYNYNMLVAREDVFEKFCEWLFGILDAIETRMIENNVVTSKRYMGYIGENLTTLYFMANQDKLRIAHMGVDILN